MKKTFITLLLSTSLLLLTGCGSKTNEESNTNNSSTEQSQIEDKNSVVDKESKTENNIENEKKEETNSTNTVEKDEKTNITIFIPNDNADGLNKKEVTVNHLTAYSIVNALADNGVVPKTTKALKFDVKNKIGYLDISSSIYDLNSGSSAETLMLDSIRETFLKAFNIEKIKLTVDGKPYTGRHIEVSPDDFL